MTDLERQILQAGEAAQVIQFNPDAALQKQIFADGFVPNSPEFEEEVDGAVYVGQRAEHLETGEVRVYYVPKGLWEQVTYVVRPALYADFVAEPLSGTAPLTVQFTDLSIGDVESWAWDFENDGTIDSTEQNPAHVFTEPGTYSVALTVTGPAGNDNIIAANYVQPEKPAAPTEGPLFPIGVSVTEDQPAPGPYGKIRFVDGMDGDDRNDGLTKPWRTIGYACYQAGEGVTVYIRPGTYNESPRPQFARMQFRKDTRYTGDVLIGGEAGITPIIEIDTPDVTFYDVHVSWNHARADGNWNWIALRGLRAKLQKCYIYRPGDVEDLWGQSTQKEFGISVTGTDQSVIDCELRGLRTAIAVRRQARRTTIYHSKMGECLGSVFNIEDSFGEDHGLLVMECDIGSSYSGDSIQFRGDAANKQTAADIVGTVGVIIRNCDLHSAAENCIDFKAAGRVLVERCMLYGNIGSNDGPSHGWNHGSHHMISCGKAWRVEHVIIRHNVLMDGTGGIEISGDKYYMHNNTLVNNNRDYRGPNQVNDWTDKCQMAGTEQNSKRQSIHWLNNIAMNHADAEAGFYLVGSGLELNGNCYYNADGAILAEWPDSQTWQPYTLPSWKTRLWELGNVTGNEASSIEADPFLVDDGGGQPIGNPHDFKLWPSEHSDCLDAAVSLTYVVSVSGNTVTVKDAGWFSYGFGVLSHVETVTIGGEVYEVEGVDYGENKLYLDRDVTGSVGAWVYSGEHCWDIGAYQVSR